MNRSAAKKPVIDGISCYAQSLASVFGLLTMDPAADASPTSAPAPSPRPVLLRRAWPLWFRAILVVAGLGLGGLLITAACLSPSEAGYGTHQQLGLPGCTFYTATGMPCPSCGMTTSWSHTMRGQVLQALDANIGGTLLAVASLFAAPWLLVSGVLGRGFLVRFNEVVVGSIALSIFVITVIDWWIRRL